jgi:hypothetical protein
MCESNLFTVDKKYRYSGFSEVHYEVMKEIYGCEIEKGECILDYMANKNNDHLIAKSDIDRCFAGETFEISQFYGENPRVAFCAKYTPLHRNGAIDEIMILVNGC